MEIEITQEFRKAFIEHMMSDEPNEVCGLLTLSNGYVPVENVAENRVKDFAMTPEDSLRVVSDPDVIAYCHTHPGGLMCASKSDMEVQIQIGKPMIIAARHYQTRHVEIFQVGDHLLDMPLEGVPFRYNSYDCFEEIRRYMWQKRSVKLKSLPRDMYFWMTEGGIAQNPINTLHQEWGFTRFNPEAIEPGIGDVLIYQTDGAKVPNHCAIYVGNNCILHHRAGKKSGISPMTFYQSAGYLRYWLRHESAVKA
jgi:proteasome lid subunit RPN8/RPN11